VEYRLWRRDGAWIYLRKVMEPIPGRPDAHGRTRWFNTIQDVSAPKQAEQRIRRLNRVYAVLSGINTLIVRVRDRAELFREACRIAVQHGEFRMAWVGLVDPASDDISPVAWDGEVRDFFDSVPWRAGRAKAGKQGSAWRAMLEKRPMIANDIQNDAHAAMKDECRLRGINSVVVLPLVVGGNAIGVLALYAAETGFFDDEEMKLLTELAGDVSFALDHLQKSEKLDHLAYYDAVTGLSNRNLMVQRITQQIGAAQRYQRKFAVVHLDIDRFKTINETLGRQAGDLLLKQMGERLAGTTPEQEGVGRIGADEFAILLPEAEQEGDVARLMRARGKQCFEEPFRIGDTELEVTAKGGVALYPGDGADAETLLHHAEAAAQKAKDSGEAFLFYTQEMTQRVAEKLSMESKLRQALAREEFVLHYQPKIDLDTRRIVGVEALIRWQSPEHGLVPPGRFIPLLEETGLILQVGAWALGCAARDHRQWTERKLHAPRVAVNVSQIQLRQRDFVGIVERAIGDGAAIDLEITESLVMENVEHNIEKLKALRGLGVRAAIDDFGTGYSSLSYLSQLPVEALKIDRSFVSKLPEDPNAVSLVATIISLAHSLKLKVVAEGVESETQANFLRLLNCDEAQGYLFSKPVPSDDLAKMLPANTA
jgi:diguanylate cyclase (GGDEF)-like protein